MAAIVIGVLGPAIELGKCNVEPIKRQFNYLCCFNINIQSLRDEAQNLNAVRNDLQKKIAMAKRNGETIWDEVTYWLASDNEIQRKMSEIETQIPNVQSGNCLTIKSRFQLSRKAKKMAEAMKEHRGLCKFDRVSLPAPPPSMLHFPSEPKQEFQSRKKIEDEIMEALRSKKVNMIGICGMGGVGKTTMAKRIMNRVREENLCDEVVMVVVSQQIDVFKIQQEIAESLGLKFEEETLPARASKLHARLIGSHKGILLVLDDVWEKLNLEHIGIPCHERGFQGCTILLTSRNRDALDQMDVRKVCAIETLTEQEAWLLFKEKVGNWLDDSSVNFLSIAKKVAKECKGLPIALITIGCALKDRKRESVWKNALDQLKNLYAIDMTYVLREVHNPLKVSYEFLENQHAKSLFLLCCLFPEDSNISLDDLTMYSMGLYMFGGIKLGLARSRVLGLVEMLKSRSLLLDGRDEHHVKMHDVVRDVAIFIAGKEGLIVDVNLSTGSTSCRDCKWISVFPEKRSELSNFMTLNFPSLRLLMMHGSSFGDEFEIKKDFCFSERMKELNVLSFKFVSLKSIQLLKNLRTLHLERCNSLETISIVGEQLLGLEILCCRHCLMIEELPVEIGRLNRLRLLEFSNCGSLKTIAPGIISNLVELEELKMRNSFNSWESIEANGKETQKNVSLKELESLLNLTHLEIDISDYTLAAEELHLSSISSIVKYCIQINSEQFMFQHEKCIGLGLPRDITLGSWIREFLSGTEALVLGGDGSNNLVQSQAHKYLKLLAFGSCSTVKKLVDTTSSISINDWRTVGHDIFPALEFMWLIDLPNLEEICDGSILEGSPNSFKNLKKLRLMNLPALKHLWKSSPNQNINISLANLSSIGIWSCDKLHNLFSLALIAKDALLQLETLKINDCKMMEEIFLSEELNKKDGGGQSHYQIITFSKFKSLVLKKLESLTTLCKGLSESIEFPVLEEMEIENCPKLTSFDSSIWDNHQNSTGGHDHDVNSLHLFCSQMVAFGGLKHLTIRYYDNNINNIWCRQIRLGFFNILEVLQIFDCIGIRSLFSSSIVEEFVNLKELSIKGCWEMEKVIGDEEKLCEKSLFARLERLTLENLQKLRSFCEWSCDIELPSLRIVRIFNCPLMENFTMGSLSIPKFKWANINGNEFEDMRDLNGVIQSHFRANEESTSSPTEEEKGKEEEQEDKSEIKKEEIEEIY